MDRKKIKQLLILMTLSAFAAFAPVYAYAQSIDVPGDPYEEPPIEPTPIEELSPGGEGEILPGTEPLYDKGITITQIEIEGNKLISDETILKSMRTQPGSLYNKQRLENDLKRIYDLGYFTDRLKIVPIATREGVHLRIEIEENPVVNSFEISGQSVIPKEELLKPFSSQVGMPQNMNAINQGIQDVEDLYKDKGYILARVEDIQEDPPGAIQLNVNEGKIHKVSFAGNKKTKDFVIRRAMAQREGEVYNEKTTAEDMKRIFSAQTFSDVRRVVKASPDIPGEYELVIEVDEKKTGAISFGGGVDTGTGLFGSIGYSEPNFLGRGQNVSAMLSVGTGVWGTDSDTVDHRVIQSQISWFNPSIAETANSLGTSLYARDLASFNVPLAIERRIGGEITWSRPLESILGAAFSLGLGFENVNLREGVSQRQLDRYSITPAERSEQLSDGSFAYLSPSISFDSRDNRFNPSQGWLNSFGSRLALGVDANSYGTVTANLRRYLKVTDGATFALNFQGGGTAFGDNPAFNLFRMGGSYTIRGFQEGGIGVGKHYLLGSAELRTKVPFLKMFDKFPIYDMLQAALFTDAGLLFDEPSTNRIFDRPGYGISVGAGLRMNMPALGPIRIDWATPLGGDTGDHTRRFNFGVGQKF